MDNIVQLLIQLTQAAYRKVQIVSKEKIIFALHDTDTMANKSFYCTKPIHSNKSGHKNSEAFVIKK